MVRDQKKFRNHWVVHNHKVRDAYIYGKFKLFCHLECMVSWAATHYLRTCASSHMTGAHNTK